MRPYLAVIADSFREALASRVLWIVLLMITVFLLALSPLGYRQTRSSTLRLVDLLDPAQMAVRLNDEFRTHEPSPGRRIWRLMDEDLRERMKKAPQRAAKDPRSLYEDTAELLEELNAILSERDLYHPSAWRDVSLGDEAQQLIDRGIASLEEQDLRRLNRLLLESAYRGIIRESPPLSIQFLYAGYPVYYAIPIREETFASLIRRVLLGFMNFFIGVVAVFVAIVVTAPIIPQMFESGSVELLLSKPVSRVLLFLAKFAGACAFILVCATYLIGGFWLLAGFRFGVWDVRFLACIPIFLFLFSIYYSVSALAGLVWRSAIVAVMVTIIFWAACLCVGLAWEMIGTGFVAPKRIVRIVPTKESTIAVTENGSVQEWNDGARGWDPVFLPSVPSLSFHSPFWTPKVRDLGPIYDRQTDHLLVISRDPTGRAHGSEIETGKSAEAWARRAVATAPVESVALLTDSHGDAIVVARKGVFRLPAAATDPSGRREDDPLFVDLPNLKEVTIGVDLGTWHPKAAALDPTTDRLVVFESDRLLRLDPDGEGAYLFGDQQVMDVGGQPVAVAYSGSTILLVRADGQIDVIDANRLEARSRVRPEGTQRPRAVVASPGGRWFAVVFHCGTLWLYDATEDRFEKPSGLGQGDISAAAFGFERELFVADQVAEVTAYQLPDRKIVDRMVPDLDLLQTLYRYAVVPIYTIFPKPGELDQTTRYLLSDEPSATLVIEEDAEVELGTAREELHPWSPVVSSVIFMGIVLSIACVYVHRTEF